MTTETKQERDLRLASLAGFKIWTDQLGNKKITSSCDGQNQAVEVSRLIELARDEALEEAKIIRDQCEALCDSSYIAGVRAGWNLGIAHDKEGMQKIYKSREGYVKVLNEIRARKDK